MVSADLHCVQYMPEQTVQTLHYRLSNPWLGNLTINSLKSPPAVHPIDYGDLIEWLDHRHYNAWRDLIPGVLASGFSETRYGDLPRWLTALESLPRLHPSRVDLDREVRVGEEQDISDQSRATLQRALQELMPWRKGPFHLYGIELDAEWRSDMKWNRIADKITPLAGRQVLDVGCGNGYYMLRMLGQGAARVLGVDPSPRFVVQFEMIKRLAGGPLPAHILPMTAEQMPTDQPLFDTVFSMGVLYHRRSPLDHLLELRNVLRPGGELVLETLVIEGDASSALVPRDRYAQMRNVWFIPSVKALELWLSRCGFEAVECLDVSATTVDEQRPTDWMTFHSLADFLDPSNPSKTIEGHPAPVRATLRATLPSTPG